MTHMGDKKPTLNHLNWLKWGGTEEYRRKIESNQRQSQVVYHLKQQYNPTEAAT